MASVGLSDGLDGTNTPELVLASKLNANPTMPAANVAPPCSAPLLLSMISSALPSPGHQATMPEGGGTQGGGAPVGTPECSLLADRARMLPARFEARWLSRNPPSVRQTPVRRNATPSKTRGLKNPSSPTGLRA